MANEQRISEQFHLFIKNWLYSELKPSCAFTVSQKFPLIRMKFNQSKRCGLRCEMISFDALLSNQFVDENWFIKKKISLSKAFWHFFFELKQLENRLHISFEAMKSNCSYNGSPTKELIDSVLHLHQNEIAYENGFKGGYETANDNDLQIVRSKMILNMFLLPDFNDSTIILKRFQ